MKALKNLPKALAILGLITFGMSFTTTSAQGASSTAGFLEGFNERGIVMTSISSGDDEARGIALQADEKFVVAGYTSNGTDKDFAVARGFGA